MGFQLLGDEKTRERLTGTARHDQLAAVRSPKPLHHIADGGLLVRARLGRLTPLPRPQLCRRRRPVHRSGPQIVEAEEGTPLLLLLDGALAGSVDQIGGGDEHPVGEHPAPGLGEELVDVLFRHPVLRVVCLGLDGPQAAVAVLGHQVDTGVSAPPAGPVVPQPDGLQLMLVDRVVLEEPLADLLELPTPDTWVLGEAGVERIEIPHGGEFRDEARRDGSFRAGVAA